MRQDYIMRMIEELGRAIRQILFKRSVGQDDEALRYVLHCLERHLGLDAERMAQSSPDELLGVLTVDQSLEDARDRCLAFAALQYQAGMIFLEKGAKPAVAQSAFYLALTFALHAWNSYPQDPAMPNVLTLEELLAHMDEKRLSAEVRMQLDAYRASRQAPVAPLG